MTEAKIVPDFIGTSDGHQSNVDASASASVVWAIAYTGARGRTTNSSAFDGGASLADLRRMAPRVSRQKVDHLNAVQIAKAEVLRTYGIKSLSAILHDAHAAVTGCNKRSQRFFQPRKTA